MNLNSGLQITLFAKFELDQVIILKIIQVSLFFVLENDAHIENKKLPWQHLITMVIDKICKMTVKGEGPKCSDNLVSLTQLTKVGAMFGLR